MKKVRAKFTVQEVTEYAYGGKRVKLQAQYDPNQPEDQSFSKATPSAAIEMLVDNPAAQGLFRPGAVLYADFTPAD